jgi:two-component system, chemotaxis family, chemotaxis protein CheY
MARIMVVDDAQFIRMRVSKLLIENGHEVFEAADGMAAIKTYRQINPDVVFMDITMPGKDGLAALVEIRQFDPQAKVVMLTALGQQAMILQAMQAGAKDFLVKPHDPERMLKILQKVLAAN